ncbi:MAG: conjugal transfer protein TraN [Alphaproteobacteria bacterium]|nr:conjugal transfer protein TraN [Alphaproteobacteria bacterium]
MRLLGLVMVLLAPLSVKADHTLESRQREIMGLAQSTNPHSISDLVTANPPEAGLNEVHALEAAAERAFATQPYANDVKEMAETRQYFVLDSQKDPIFVNSKDTVQDPEEFLKGPMTNRRPQTTYERKTCRESKPKTELKCSKVLLSQKIYIEPEQYEKRIPFKMLSGYTPHVYAEMRRDFTSAGIIKVSDEKIHVKDEEWTNGCHTLEKKAEAGVCRRIRSVCPKGEETREVMGEFLKTRKSVFFDTVFVLRGPKSFLTDVNAYMSGGIGKFFVNPEPESDTFEPTGETVSRQVTRPCWRYEETYECSQPSPNNCEPLRQQSCVQIKSACLTKIGEECVEWEQEYRCPVEVLPDEKDVIAETGYEMPVVDTTLSYTANNEMNEAIAKLSIFHEMQGEMRADASLNTITVFKGAAKACTIGFAGFKNCCTKKGWGTSIGLQGCDETDLELAEKNKRGLCVEVGSYCAAKVAGVCVRKKRSSCCFPSKLSRIVHEQGRPQLGMGWGESKSPDCRGFTPEELARLDFDRLNLSELFDEISSRVKQVSSRVVKRNMSNRIQTMTEGFENQSESGDY